MKKVLALLLACASLLSTKAQTMSECSNAERILLDERPKFMNERTAYEIIKNHLLFEINNEQEVTFPTSIFPPKSYEKVFYDRTFLVKKEDAVGYAWKTETVYKGNTAESINWTLIIFWPIAFILGVLLFLFSGEPDRPMIKRRMLGILFCAVASGILWAIVIEGSGGLPDVLSERRGAVLLYGWLSIFISMLLGGITYILSDEDRREELFKALRIDKLVFSR